MWDAAKAVLRGKFIVLNDCIRKEALKSMVWAFALRNGGGGKLKPSW